MRQGLRESVPKRLVKTGEGGGFMTAHTWAYENDVAEFKDAVRDVVDESEGARGVLPE